MKNDEKIELAIQWFNSITPSQQAKVVRELFDHAIRSEWINVWNHEDRLELAQESGNSVDYTAPYFTTCGDPIA